MENQQGEETGWACSVCGGDYIVGCLKFNIEDCVR